MKHFMEIAGRRMAYLDEGQGPVLLFGHSYLWDSAMWAPQVEALKGSYRCIVPELWGHGDSDSLPEGPCSLETLARDHLARVIVSSGYSSDPVLADCTQYGFTGHLSKPFRLAELRDVIADAIGKPG